MKLHFGITYGSIDGRFVVTVERRIARKKNKKSDAQRPQVAALVPLHPVQNLPGGAVVQRAFYTQAGAHLRHPPT